MLQEVGDERLRVMIEKHIVRPKLEQKKNELIGGTAKKVDVLSRFVGQYYEDIQRQLEREEQKEHKEEKSNNNGQKLINAGKRLVGAFSYFGFKKEDKDSTTIETSTNK